MPTATFRRLAWATAIETYLLIIIGAATKAYGAGLSCPDWPLCFGKLVPQMNFLVFLEWFHRLGAALITVLALAATVSAFRLPARERRPWVRWTLFAMALVLVQSIFGGLTVIMRLEPWVEAAHTGLATAFLAVWVMIAVSAGMQERGRQILTAPMMWVVPLVAALSTYSTMVIGSYMKAAHGGLACPDWPLCYGQVIPAFSPDGLILLQFGHRLAALAAFVLVIYTAYFIYRRAAQEPALVVPAGISAGLMLVQVLIGGVAVAQKLPPLVTVTHLAVAAALVATLMALTTVAYRLSAAGVVSGGPGAGGGPPGGQHRRCDVLAYVQLMKPRILLLILVTGYGAMWVAGREMPPPALTFFTLLGLLLTSGGANAVNMWYDRDIDAVMSRTRNRPLPSGRLEPWQALAFGVAAGIAGVLVLAIFVNLLAAVWALVGYLYYVIIYTMWLKRSSAQNIVIGGGAGAIPPLVGWAAVTGTVSLAAVIMFLVVFLWTPPHFWALALFRKEEYQSVGVPMLPAVRGVDHTKWQILVYALLVVPASLLLYWTGVVGPAYPWFAVLLGVWFVSACVALLRENVASARWAHRVFGYSIVYLGALFLAMVLSAH